MTNYKRDLSGFSGTDYNRGRGYLWQAFWVLTSYFVFQRIWFPRRMRPSILRLFGAEVGTGVLIRNDVKIHWPWKLRLGNNTWIGEGVRLLNLSDIHIEDSVCISQEAFVCTGSHDVKSPTFEFKNRPIKLSTGVWVCARVFIYPGSVVPKYAVVTLETNTREFVERGINEK